MKITLSSTVSESLVKVLFQINWSTVNCPCRFVWSLEQFVCHVYSSTGHTTLIMLRWELFGSKNLEGEVLPLTRAALLPHIIRTNYIDMKDKSYRTICPALPLVEQNSWSVKEGVYVPTRCLILPESRAVIELTKCACNMQRIKVQLLQKRYSVHSSLGKLSRKVSPEGDRNFQAL